MFDLAAAPANLSFTLSVLNEAETVELFKQYSAIESSFHLYGYLAGGWIRRSNDDLCMCVCIIVRILHAYINSIAHWS